MNPSDIRPALMYVEDAYDLGRGFLKELFNESDWSFVVKAHALVEAATAQLLTAELGEPRLKLVIAQLEHSNSQSGRLAFLKALNLATEDQRRFIRRFSELRNHLVHNVHNVRFTFVDGLAAMSEDQQKAFTEWVGYFGGNDVARKKYREWAMSTPKLTLWLGVLLLVGQFALLTEKAGVRRQRIQEALRKLDELGGGDQPPEI